MVRTLDCKLFGAGTVSFYSLECVCVQNQVQWGPSPECMCTGPSTVGPGPERVCTGPSTVGPGPESVCIGSRAVGPGPECV